MLSTLLLLPACREGADSAVPRLIKELNSQDRSIRNKAALSLARYGSDAEPATRALVKLLSDENPGVRSSAAYALRSIGTPEAVKALDAYQR